MDVLKTFFNPRTNFLEITYIVRYKIRFDEVRRLPRVAIPSLRLFLDTRSQGGVPSISEGNYLDRVVQ